VLAVLAHGDRTERHPIDPLTEREAEVLRLLAQGLTNKDIAQALIISVRTVEAHLRNIYAKLGVDSRTEAALWSVRNGYASTF
jgi:DNA-binding NarL/FixJ family response regulator